MNASKSINRDLDSLTITFPCKPAARFLDALKANGWRWSKRHVCWYTDVTDQNHQFADAICAGQIPTTARLSTLPQAGPAGNHSSDGGMAQANEEAYFDDFCQRNGI